MTRLDLPEHLSYTADHEWVDIPPGAAIPDGEVKVGLSTIAVGALGEIVFVELPEPGTEVAAGQACGEVESTKAVSDLVSPVSGTVVTVNSALADDPAPLNQDPFGAGWLFTVTVTKLGELLSVDEYRAEGGG